MEVVIYGTKGGYRIFYKTQGAPSIGSEIRNNVSSEAAIGKSAYSIAFAANGCVFTKYIIIRDTLRSDATGFIAFSLFFMLCEELSNKGDDVKSILDELSNYYLENYVRNFSINKGVTDIIQEDWSFVTNITSKKIILERRNSINIEVQAGTKEASYVFYEDDYKLQEYFSKPFQEEYNGYKQIFFINGAIRNNSSDLLNAIRNSGVELNVDLNNEYFFLCNSNSTYGLSITANEIPRNDKNCSNIIRAKDWVEISYIKENYKHVKVGGRLSNPDSAIYKYLEIKGNQIFVKYDQLISSCTPLEKTIFITVKDWKENSVDDAIIYCRNGGNSKAIENKNQIVFKGEELRYQWIISATNNHFHSLNKQIDFVKECSGDFSSIDIFLTKHKLKVIVHEGSYDGVEINDNLIFSKDEFITDEIGKNHKITASCRGYKTTSFEYNPINDILPKHIILQKDQSHLEKKSNHYYNVSTGKHGTLKYGNNCISYEKNGIDVKNLIVANKGYKFIRFEEQSGTLVAQYEKVDMFKDNLKLILSSIVVLIFISISIALWMYFDKSEIKIDKPNHDISNEIISYIEGDSLILDTLIEYKQRHQIERKAVSDKLEIAIKKRKAINSLNFSEIKKLHYYQNQNKFILAIRSIDSTNYVLFKHKLINISSWSLDKIADSVNTLLNKIKAEADHKKEVQNVIIGGANEEPKKKAVQPGNIDHKKDDKFISSPKYSNNPIDITKELQSDTVTKDNLQKWKIIEMDKYNNSLNIYLEFWASIKQGMKIEETKQLLKKIKSDKYLQNSELYIFLKSVSDSPESFEKYNNTPGKKSCKSIYELRNKIK